MKMSFLYIKYYVILINSKIKLRYNNYYLPFFVVIVVLQTII
jgi:hypothetical protein